MSRLLMYGGIGLSLVFIGWQACGWYRDSQALDDYNRALEATETAYREVFAEQTAMYQAEVQKSLNLEKQNKALRESVGALREEIDHATFTPPIVDGCVGHPVDSPDFQRLYDRAARGGNPTARTSDLSGVSPRDD